MGEIQSILDIDHRQIVDQLVRLGVAFFLAVAIGWNREKEAKSAGLRTFPLVAISSCSFVMLAVSTFASSPDAIARVMQGLITGIGFIGGGAILKNNGTVTGTATAASIWNTAAIGAAVALRRYDFAVTLTVVNVLILHLVTPLKDVVKE